MRSIIFFTDTAMLPGLHVALLSMLNTLEAPNDLRIVIFTDGVSPDEKNKLRETHAINPRHATSSITDFVPKGNDAFTDGPRRH